MPFNPLDRPSANLDRACVNCVSWTRIVSTSSLTPLQGGSASTPSTQPPWAPLAFVYFLFSEGLMLIIKSCPAY